MGAARRGEVLHHLEEELILAGGEERPEVVTLDLSSLDSLEGKAEEIIQVFGRLDVLINCGGVSVRGGAVETLLEVHKRVMDTNYFGTDDKLGGNYCQFRDHGADEASSASPQGPEWSSCEHFQPAGKD